MPPAASKKEAEVTGNDGIGRETVLNVSDDVQRPCIGETKMVWRDATLRNVHEHILSRITKADWR